MFSWTTDKPATSGLNLTFPFTINFKTGCMCLAQSLQVRDFAGVPENPRHQHNIDDLSGVFDVDAAL